MMDIPTDQCGVYGGLGKINNTPHVLEKYIICGVCRVASRGYDGSQWGLGFRDDTLSQSQDVFYARYFLMIIIIMTAWAWLGVKKAFFPIY